MQPNGRNTSADSLHTDETMGWLRRTIVDLQRRHMHYVNSEGRLDIPCGIGCEIAAKVEFCLAIGDRAGLGLRNMAQKLGSAANGVPRVGERADFLSPESDCKGRRKRWRYGHNGHRAVATTCS